MGGRGMSAGKGDKPRPVDSKAFAEGWERVFGKKRGKVKEKPTTESRSSGDILSTGVKPE